MKPSYTLKKKLVTGIIALVAITGVATATVLTLQHFAPAKTPEAGETATESQSDKLIKEANETVEKAGAAETANKQAEAIDLYKEAIEKYTAAGDTFGAENARIQIEYIESYTKQQ